MPRNKSHNPFENYLPAVVIREAIEAADETGAMPPFDTPMLLRALNLDGEEPDGKTLMYRLTGGRPTLTNRFRAFRLVRGALELINVTNERIANPAEEAIAQSLGAVVTRQIMREDTLCGGAKSIALDSTREDIIPPEVMEIIRPPQQMPPAEPPMA